ncbi:MAG: YicC family protein, partial [Planctomycetes bacterium]|nr:YicC family protein [Planctomycetota bacterium]
MLLSMTGHGEAHCQQEGAIVRVEVRAVNNRFLKVSTRTSEGFGSLEPLIEAAVRQSVRRGTIQVNVRIEREPRPDDFRLNEAVLAGYRKQLDALNQQAGVCEPVRLETLLALPGVVSENGLKDDRAEAIWPLIETTLSAALENLSRMRMDEGAAMAADLHANCRLIAKELEQIEQQAPMVVEAYRKRLAERLNKLLADYDVTLQPADTV